MIDENLGVGSIVEELGSDECASDLSDPQRERRPEKREWFIRNMPSDLVEQVNAAAKVARITVAEWLSEKLRHILAQETGMLDDGARIARLEKEVQELDERVERLCEFLTAEQEAKRRAERGRTPDELRARYKELTQGRR